MGRIMRWPRSVGVLLTKPPSVKRCAPRCCLKGQRGGDQNSLHTGVTSAFAYLATGSITKMRASNWCMGLGQVEIGEKSVMAFSGRTFTLPARLLLIFSSLDQESWFSMWPGCLSSHYWAPPSQTGPSARGGTTLPRAICTSSFNTARALEVGRIEQKKAGDRFLADA